MPPGALFNRDSHDALTEGWLCPDGRPSRRYRPAESVWHGFRPAPHPDDNVPRPECPSSRERPVLRTERPKSQLRLRSYRRNKVPSLRLPPSNDPDRKPGVHRMEESPAGSRTIERRQGDRRSGVGRRTLGDRRSGGKRRIRVVAVAVERRVLPDRRAGERRIGPRRIRPDRRSSAPSPNLNH